MVDQILGRLVLGGALRDHGDQGRVARGVEPGRNDEGDVWLAAKPLGERVDLALGGAIWQLGCDLHRSVGPGPEPLGVQVVGLAGHRVRWVVAGVREAEPHAEGRSGQSEQQRRCQDRGRPGMTLNRVAPARRWRIRASLGPQRPAEEGDPQAVDSRPQVAEQGRQQGDRREHHHEDRERCGDRDAVHVGEPGEEQTEDGDDHRAAGDDHAPPRRGDRFDHGVVAILCPDGLRIGSGSRQAASSRSRPRSRSARRPRWSSRGR